MFQIQEFSQFLSEEEISCDINITFILTMCRLHNMTILKSRNLPQKAKLRLFYVINWVWVVSLVTWSIYVIQTIMKKSNYEYFVWSIWTSNINAATAFESWQIFTFQIDRIHCLYWKFWEVTHAVEVHYGGDLFKYKWELRNNKNNSKASLIWNLNFSVASQSWA